MKDKKYKTQKSSVFLDQNNICHVSYMNLAGISLEEAKEEVELCIKISNGVKMLVVVDLSKVKSVNREARNYYTDKKITNNYSAVALIVNSPVSRVIGNYFIGLNKPTVPLKLFSNKQETIGWLKGLNHEKTL